jgi:hypothetical protein
MAAVDASDLTEPPEPRADSKRRGIVAVAGIVAAVLLVAWIRRRLRRGADDTVFDVVEESAATLAEILVDELLPG